MYITYANGNMYISGIDFNPQLTLIDSAQVFHWTQDGEEFIGVSAGHTARVIKTTDGFCVKGIPEQDIPFWTRYFDLERDYDEIIRACEDYPIAQHAMRLLPGLRVLNQPTWETLLTFIISANNNVPRIRSIVHQLIQKFGINGAFPTPEQLSEVTEDELRAIGCGYRAAYLIRTAQMVRDGFNLDALAQMPYEQAHAELLKLAGVGDKVADCVQLFGIGFSEAFPVDVWVERLMKKWFIGEEKISKKELRHRAQEIFGKNAGIIQQSLFHCARLGLIPMEENPV